MAEFLSIIGTVLMELTKGYAYAYQVPRFREYVDLWQ